MQRYWRSSAFIYSSGQLCQVWVRAGTRQQRRYILIRDISLPPTMHQNILAYHALTGCDTVSQMSGHGKKSTWMVFKQQATLLFGLRHGVLSSSSMRDAEQFLCKIYSPNTDEASINEIRYRMFQKGAKQQEKLPPTQCCMEEHI